MRKFFTSTKDDREGDRGNRPFALIKA